MLRGALSKAAKLSSSARCLQTVCNTAERVSCRHHSLQCQSPDCASWVRPSFSSHGSLAVRCDLETYTYKFKFCAATQIPLAQHGPDCWFQMPHPFAFSADQSAVVLCLGIWSMHCWMLTCILQVYSSCTYHTFYRSLPQHMSAFGAPNIDMTLSAGGMQRPQIL